MKSIVLKVATIIIFIAFGCGEDDDLLRFEDRLLEVRNKIISECKSENDHQGIYNKNVDEYIELKFSESNFLKINHFNVWFNCHPSIDIQAKIDNSAITYSATDTFGIANCICPYDLSCEIGPLEITNYEFKFYRC